MSKYHVVAAEGWGIRVPYDVEAPTDEEAVQMIKDQELAVQTYSVIWERHADSGSAAPLKQRLAEISQELGITKERSRQIAVREHAKLRELASREALEPLET